MVVEDLSQAEQDDYRELQKVGGFAGVRLWVRLRVRLCAHAGGRARGLGPAGVFGGPGGAQRRREAGSVARALCAPAPASA